MARLQEVEGASIAGEGSLPLADDGNSFKPSGYKREYKGARKHADGGHTRTTTPAELDLTLQANRSFSVQALNAMDDVTITVELSDGSKHLMAGAYSEETQEISGGNTKVKFIANESTQIA